MAKTKPQTKRRTHDVKKNPKTRLPKFNGIYVCLDGKPLRGPFDTWKDADICLDVFDGYMAPHKIKALTVQKFRRGVWVIGPRP